MQTDERATQNFESLHEVTDDPSCDVDEPVSKAALDLSTYHTKEMTIRHFLGIDFDTG